ncbi:hypothetical protein BGZ58_004275 [Dissophora ornata]|nr:hypothetical protein BGZ58_004275 [Dissophora ornata]
MNSNSNSITGSNAASPIIPTNPSLPASGSQITTANNFTFFANGNPVSINEKVANVPGKLANLGESTHNTGNPVSINKNVANVPGKLANINDKLVNLGESTHNPGNLAANYMVVDEFSSLLQFVYRRTEDIVGLFQQLEQKVTELSHKKLQLIAQQVMIPEDESCPPGLIEYISKTDKDLDDLMTRKRLLELAINQHKQLVQRNGSSNNNVDLETNHIDRFGANSYSSSEDQYVAPTKKNPRYTPDDAVAKGSSHKFVFTTAHEFLYRFRKQEEKTLGKANFLRNGPRLLALVILDNNIMDDYIQRKENIPSEELNWDRCEGLFIAAALTPGQQTDEVVKVLLAGIEAKSKETYKSYAARLQRIARMYKLSDGDRYYLQLMKNSVPAHTLNFMTLFLKLRHNGAALTDSIDKFCSALSFAEGPDYETKVQGRRTADKEPARENNKSDYKRSRPSHAKKNCKNCGVNNTHDTNECVICSKCNKRGHYANDCRSSRYQPYSRDTNSRKHDRGNNNEPNLLEPNQKITLPSQKETFAHYITTSATVNKQASASSKTTEDLSSQGQPVALENKQPEEEINNNLSFDTINSLQTDVDMPMEHSETPSRPDSRPTVMSKRQLMRILQPKSKVMKRNILNDMARYSMLAYQLQNFQQEMKIADGKNSSDDPSNSDTESHDTF